MKTTSEYITLLRKYMAENASKYGIMRMGIFGSVARGRGMYAYIPRVKKDGTPLTDKGGTQKFTRVRAVKENGV